MLSEQEATNAWERMVEAEVRSLYFGDLAAAAVQRKQLIGGSTLFLSSGAAVSVFVSYTLVAGVMSILVALMSAYSIAVGLDKKASNLANLHSEWNVLADTYRDIWSNWHSERARFDYADAVRSEQKLSRASTEATYDEERLKKWTSVVFARYQQEPSVQIT
jgi:hypothetical protein